MEKLLTLDEWARAVYETPPSKATLLRWVKQCRIYPPPEKHGRDYRVLPSARYSDPTKPVKLVREPATRSIRSPGGMKLSLVERLRLEGK